MYTTPMNAQTEKKNAKLQGMDRLRQLRDELRLKVHLLGMDAQRDFRILEKDLDELERRVTTSANDLGDEIQRAIKRIEPIFDSLGRTGV
jgi:hypothetical protein